MVTGHLSVAERIRLARRRSCSQIVLLETDRARESEVPGKLTSWIFECTRS